MVKQIALVCQINLSNVPRESRALSQPARTPSQYGLGNQIKSQSVASSSSKARRVTPEERLRQEQEIAEEERQSKCKLSH